MSGAKKIAVDFGGIPLRSSSFADEVFGKLFTDIRPMVFMRKFGFKNTLATVNQLIDRAISQRVASGAG